MGLLLFSVAPVVVFKHEINEWVSGIHDTTPPKAVLVNHFHCYCEVYGPSINVQ